MKILALDVSTKSTGWFVTKRSCGKIVPSAKLSFEDKLVFFRKELEKLLNKYKPALVVMEDAYYRPGFGSIHTLKALVKFAGVAIEICTSLGIRIEIITATTARKNCCGAHEGKFGKQEVFDFFINKKEFDKVCQRLYGRPCNFKADNDLTDAAALSHAGKLLFAPLPR